MCPSESQEPPTRALFADFDALQVDELQAHQRKTRVDRLTDVEPHNENSLNLKRMMAMTPELVLECPADLTHPDERALGGNRDKWSGKREDGSEVQLWFTALHVGGCDTRHFLTTSSRLSKAGALPVVRVEMEKLLTSLDHRFVEDALQLGLVSPQTPDRLVPIVPDGGYLDANEADVLPFLAVHTARSRLKPCTTFVVPSARDVAVDDHIAITGYTGRAGVEWAASALIKPSDWVKKERTLRQQYREQNLTMAEVAQKLEDERLHFRLESHVLSSRLAELNHRDGDIIHPEYPVVSPGSVVAVVEQTIAHSASSMPGLSGGAGVMTNSPAELVGMHVQSYIDSSRPSGILVSVHNKVFVYAYAKHALPLLTEASAEQFAALSAEALPRLHGYLQRHETFIKRAELGDVLEAFWARHSPPTPAA